MFFKALILLIIPLIVKFYIFIIDNLSTKFLIFMNCHINLDTTTKPGYVTISLKTEQPTIEDAWDLTKVKLEFVIMKWNIHNQIRIYAQNCLYIEKIFKQYEGLFTSICYLIGWSYYLYYIINPIQLI